MKLAMNQSYFFPYIGYFQLIHAVDKFILYDHLTYIKGGWIQKNRISQPNNTECFITIPLQKRSSNKYICELPISYAHPWQKKIINQLKNAYIKSPFFNEVFHFIEELIMKDFYLITDFNSYSIKVIAQLLDIQTTIVQGVSIEKELNNATWPYETRTQRILLACQQEKADIFINAIGGKGLYSKEEFREQDVDLFFIQTEKQAQIGESIKPMPDLSIIDALFNYGINGTKELLTAYSLTPALSKGEGADCAI